MRILVTGGCGFIGSALIERIFYNTNYKILNIDKLTYASKNSFCKEIKTSKKYSFLKLDICSSKIISILNEFKPNVLIHMAAESHVDNSINSPSEFMKTNILGTYNLLIHTKKYLENNNKIRKNFKFINFSTDEVFGDLDDLKIKLFSENTKYNPSSPYSASKASADHLVRAWYRTYKLPSIIINSSNNYGPRQHSEKLIPLSINNALKGKKIPIYGNGQQKRDWLYVEDCADAIIKVLEKGSADQSYNIGARAVFKNIDLIKKVCKILDKLYPVKLNSKIESKINSYFDLIYYVKDRPGHDKSYAINPKKIENDLKWKPKFSINDGLKKTVLWYIDNHIKMSKND